MSSSLASNRSSHLQAHTCGCLFSNILRKPTAAPNIPSCKMPEAPFLLRCCYSCQAGKKANTWLLFYRASCLPFLSSTELVSLASIPLAVPVLLKCLDKPQHIPIDSPPQSLCYSGQGMAKPEKSVMTSRAVAAETNQQQGGLEIMFSHVDNLANRDEYKGSGSLGKGKPWESWHGQAPYAGSAQILPL